MAIFLALLALIPELDLGICQGVTPARRRTVYGIEFRRFRAQQNSLHLHGIVTVGRFGSRDGHLPEELFSRATIAERSSHFLCFPPAAAVQSHLHVLHRQFPNFQSVFLVFSMGISEVGGRLGLVVGFDDAGFALSAGSIDL